MLPNAVQWVLEKIPWRKRGRDDQLVATIRERLGAHQHAEEVLHEMDGETQWNGWMADPNALAIAVEHLSSDSEPLVIEEYGSGFSTDFTTRLLRRYGRLLRLYSHEHVTQYRDETVRHVDSPDVCVKLQPLKQLTDAEVEGLYAAEDPWTYFHSVGSQLPADLYLRTRVPNCFYQLDEDERDRRPDLVTLDGPNGSGRSILWPLLCGRLRSGAIVVVDDATHYPFVENLRLCFEIEVLAELKEPGNDWLVARVLRELPLERRASFRLSAVAAPS